MLLVTLLVMSGAAPAQTRTSTAQAPRDGAPAAPQRAVAARAQTRDQTPVQADHPDAALIEYLGEFDDAADGLDAMGLEESTTADGKANGGGR